MFMMMVMQILPKLIQKSTMHIVITVIQWVIVCHLNAEILLRFMTNIRVVGGLEDE